MVKTGKQIRMTFPDNYVLDNLFYPGTNLLHTVTGNNGATQFAEITDYEASGKIRKIVHPNGVTTQYDYDPMSGRLDFLSTTATRPTSRYLQKNEYVYSPAGDIREIDDTLESRVYTYYYDNLHRLTGEVCYGCPPTAQLVDAVNDFTGSGPYHAAKHVTLNNVTYDYFYDFNGNMTAGPDMTDPGHVTMRNMTFNAENMPVRVVTSGGTVDITYGP